MSCTIIQSYTRLESGVKRTLFRERLRCKKSMKIYGYSRDKLCASKKGHKTKTRCSREKKTEHVDFPLCRLTRRDVIIKVALPYPCIFGLRCLSVAIWRVIREEVKSQNKEDLRMKAKMLSRLLFVAMER